MAKATPRRSNFWDPSATLKDANERIKAAWIMALVCGSFTSLIMLVSVLGKGDFLGFEFNRYAFIEVVMIFALAFGIYRKSRTCAVVMFVLYLVDHIAMAVIVQGSAPSGPFPFLSIFFFAACFAGGVEGAFKYHRLKGAANA